jgi:predicted metal-binding protein
MAKVKQMVKTANLGMAEIDVVVCDGCGKISQDRLAVNWLEVKPLESGVNATTMGASSITEEMHYCSVECLKGFVDFITMGH